MIKTFLEDDNGWCLYNFPRKCSIAWSFGSRRSLSEYISHSVLYRKYQLYNEDLFICHHREERWYAKANWLDYVGKSWESTPALTIRDGWLEIWGRHFQMQAHPHQWFHCQLMRKYASAWVINIQTNKQKQVLVFRYLFQNLFRQPHSWMILTVIKHHSTAIAMRKTWLSYSSFFAFW